MGFVASDIFPSSMSFFHFHLCCVQGAVFDHGYGVLDGDELSGLVGADGLPHEGGADIGLFKLTNDCRIVGR